MADLFDPSRLGGPAFWPLAAALGEVGGGGGGGGEGGGGVGGSGPAGRRGLTDWPSLDALDALIVRAGATTRSGRAVHLERQLGKPRRGGPAYEERVDLEGLVPTRERSWHDFFNALVWAVFPAAKRALSARLADALAHGRATAASRPPHARTREQDALAMLDEGSVLFGCRTAATLATARAALAAGDAATLETLVARGAAVGAIFGHALYEHLALGAVDRLRATIVVLPLPAEAAAAATVCGGLDQALAANLAEAGSFVTPAPTLPWREGLGQCDIPTSFAESGVNLRDRRGSASR